MLKGSFNNSTPAKQLLLTGCIVVISFLLTLFAGSIAAILFFDANIFTQPEVISENNPMSQITILKFFQAIYSLGLFIIPPFIIAYLIHPRAIEFLYLHKGATIYKFIAASLIILTAIPLINLMADFNSRLTLPDWLSGIEDWMRNSEERAKMITEKFLQMDSPGDLLCNIFLIALIPAFGEELLFRGVIQRLIIKWTRSKHLGIIMAAVFFSALHLQFFGFIPRMMMGILFGYLLIWSKSLWIPIAAHFVNNATAVITYYLMGMGTVSKEIQNIGSTDNSWEISIISLLLSFYLILLFYRRRER